ncbi:MAG: hypothetical protein ACTSVI_00075 [Promethearchaeota archaeon]
MSVHKEFSKIIKELDLPTPMSPTRKENHVPVKAQKDLNVMKGLLANNLVGEIKIWGAVYDEEKFKDAKEKLPEVIKKLQLESKEKEIKQYFESFAKIMKKFCETHIIALAEVKTMPFKRVYMHKLPKTFETVKGTLEINDKPVGYIAELPYQVERSTAYGEMKNEKPLFAPVIGNLDLNWTPPTNKPQPGVKDYIEDFSLQSNIFQSFDKQTTRNSIWRYQNYGRKGEPICDKLMANEDLMISMERITSEVDSKDFKANASVCGLVYAIDGRSIVGIVDYDGIHKNAFEALFKLSAYLEDAPRAKAPSIAGMGTTMVASPGMPSQPALPTWTEEELASRADKFLGAPALNMPVWTEEELASRADKFVGNDVNLPVWTEEELEKMRQSSGPSLNLPEWKDDPEMISCPKCGYSCHPSWDECPICNTKLPKSSGKSGNANNSRSGKPQQDNKKPLANKPPAGDKVNKQQ